MISDAIRSVLSHEGPAAFVTQGPDGPHLVATWNSYIRVLDDATLAWPAGRYRRTEENVRAGSDVRMIVGARIPEGTGFLVTGRAEFQVDTPVHASLKREFPWCRAAVLLHVTGTEKVLG